jgi:hypothetical protein
MWEWLRRLLIGDFQEPAPPSAAKAQPIVVNPDEDRRLVQAAYRLDAIRRHIEQARYVPPQRMREFFGETVAQADTLMRAGRIDEATRDATIAFVAERR